MERILSEQEILRRQSLAQLRMLGINPYPAEMFEITAQSQEIVANFNPDIKNYQQVRMAGRLMAKRIMGKASFAHLQDHQGRIQLYINRDDICPTDDKTLYNEVFKKLLDLGDFIGIEGYVFNTQTGETSVHVTRLVVLAKSLRPLPVAKEKDGVVFDAFTNPEQRYRMRYVDLTINPQIRQIFVKRTRLIQAMRQYFDAHGWL